ncbi:transcription factor Adf-1 [Drosophila grimshawi]|uniref:GH18253 n=1 Tax=Drosophila grimshawi TaxID=7222 RepID=B4JFJ5_DROGR|nr:transcription factor Adf-1 [Drosophila grimshawi]EDV93476.1 GH18253 [Drosophila grimshawi]
MGNHKVLKTAGMNLRYSMYDFIDAVKKHHIVWDREHKNFHNRELRDQAWQQIGQQLCKNFEASSDVEKQEITKTLLKRWKNTRDSYLRVNRLRKGSKEICRASYIYEKELCFLLDVKTEDEETPLKEQSEEEQPKAKRNAKLSIGRTPAKRNRSESENPIDEAETVQHKLVEDELESVLDTFSYPTNPNTISTLPGNATANERATSSSFIMDTSNSTTHSAAAAASPDPDPDQAFFDSIKPHMQRMSSDQKLDFQIEVLKILRNLNQFDAPASISAGIQKQL